MNLVLATSILQKQIQIGKTTIPLGFIFLFLAFLAVVITLNAVYLRRYRSIMTYLQRNHPQLYEDVRRKPEIGPLYSKTHNPSKALIALARRAPSLNDPKLEQLLSDFVQFDRRFVWISSVLIIAMVLALFIAGVILVY